MLVVEIEEGFCWDHGYYVGPRCPRCRSEAERSPQEELWRGGTGLGQSEGFSESVGAGKETPNG
jgi:hypothetical protein